MKNEDIDNLEIRIPESNVPRVIIIGGGFGGIELAKKIVRKPFQIVLFDRNNYHTFQPLLYQVATAGLEPDSIAGPLRQLMENHTNFYFRMARVLEVDFKKKVIHTGIGSIAYDYLVIANGAKTNYFGNQRIADTAFPLKQVPHALDLRSHLLQNFEKAVMVGNPKLLSLLLNIVIVGGGPTGVEVAGALSELRRHVLPKDYHELDFSKMGIFLVEGQERLLSGMTEKSGQRAFRYLEKLKVNVILNTIVEDYENEVVYLSNGTNIYTNTLIWAAGVSGHVISGVSSDILNGGRISVDEINKVKDITDVFAIGDIAHQISEEYPRGLPMIAPVAMQQADILAKNLVALENNKALKSFQYKNKGQMATVGRNKAVVDLPGGISFGGFFAWLIWMFVHLISIIGFRNKLVIFSNWVWSYFTYDKGTRLIIRLFIPDSKSGKS